MHFVLTRQGSSFAKFFHDVSSDRKQGELDLAFALALGIWFMSFSAIYKYLSRNDIRKHDFAWYQATHRVGDDGSVRCYVCGNTRIVSHRLMGGSYTVAHNCGKCGKTLYFSPEVS